jgi:hypothetical protein
MTFSKMTWRTTCATAAAALTLGVAPAAGAAIITEDDDACTLTATASERPFITANLPGAQAVPVSDGVFQYEISAADVPAVKARVPRDELEVRSTNLRSLLNQCAAGRPGAASLEPDQPGEDVPEARVTTAALNTTVTLDSVIFGSLPTAIDVLK